MAPLIMGEACPHDTSPADRGCRLAIRLRRIAAVSGSTRTALAFALTGLTRASQRQLPPLSPAESQAARKARLFGVIRDDAASGMSIRQIASRHHVYRRTVRQALAEPAGQPPRKRGTRPAPAIGPIQDVLDKLVGEPLTVWEIWTTVTDQHDSDALYAAIRDYVRTRRLAAQSGCLMGRPPVAQDGRRETAAPRCAGTLSAQEERLPR